MKKQLLLLGLISMFSGNSLLAGADDDYEIYEEVEDNRPAPAAAAAVAPVRTKGNTREETIHVMHQRGMNPDEYNIKNCGCYSAKIGGHLGGSLCKCEYEAVEDEPLVGTYTKAATRK